MIRRTIPAQVDRLADCCAFVREGAAGAGLDPQEMDKLDLVMEELFVNVARYAYTPGEGDVDVAYSVEAPGRLLVELADSGRAFNPLASDPPDFSRGLADRPIGGLGIYLVKTMADSIRYEREGCLNRISFVFSAPVNSGAVNPGQNSGG